MEKQRTRYKKEDDALVRVNVILTRDQLDMLNEASRVLHISRSEAVREGVGHFLDRYYIALKEKRL